MDKIKWCLNKKKGIELVNPNDNLAKAYLQEAKETLQVIDGKGNKWEVIMAYYSCYNALYALLKKIGVKCEIHDCTLELMKFFDGFNEQDYSFISELKEKRIQNQYYLKSEPLNNLLEVKTFVMKCAKILEDFNINQMRTRIKNEKK